MAASPDTHLDLPRLECQRCGHSWVPRRPTRTICPRCKSRRWAGDEQPDLLPDAKAMAMFIGIVVRNAMEDLHADRQAGISDAVMRRLNRVVRNAAYTALDAARLMRRNPRAREWVAFQLMYIPSYWEQPELLEAYAESIHGSRRRGSGGHDSAGEDAKRTCISSHRR